MITSHDVDLAAYVIDTSGVVDILEEGCNRDRRGRKMNRNHLRVFLIGGVLTLMDKGGFLVTHCYKTLTEDLHIEDQHRLGVRYWATNPDGTQEVRVLRKHHLDYITKRLNGYLAYGESEPIHDDERRRRHDVIRRYWDALLDVFDLGFDHSSVAIDATGIWSWGRGSFTAGTDTGQEDDD